nr:reverse transcriptase domain-containing protein [Tanacetum cinerariifolium]
MLQVEARDNHLKHENPRWRVDRIRYGYGMEEIIRDHTVDPLKDNRVKSGPSFRGDGNRCVFVFADGGRGSRFGNDIVDNLICTKMNFKQLSPRRVLALFRLKSDGDQIFNTGNSKSRVKLIVGHNLFPPLDNPELTIRRQSRSDPTLLNNFEMAAEGPGDLPVPDLRTMEELCQPSLNGRGGPIAPIAIQATNFGLKNYMIQQV